MSRNRISLDFAGFTVLKKQLDVLGGDFTKQAVNNALEASQQLIAEKTKAAMQPHKDTGDTAESIIDNQSAHKPVWMGNTAESSVGFSITGGGLPSIFLMHGTKLHGQPHIAPDRNLYNAVYGAAVRKEIQAIQRKEFEKVLEKVTQVNEH